MNTATYEDTAGAPLPELERGSIFHATEDHSYYLKVASNGRADDWVLANGEPAAVPVHLLAGRITQFGGKDDTRSGFQTLMAAELQLGDRLDPDADRLVTRIVTEADETTMLRVYWSRMSDQLANSDEAFLPGHLFHVTRTATAPEFGAGYPDATAQLAIASHPRATAEQLAVLAVGEITGMAGFLLAQNPNAGAATLAELLGRSSSAGTWAAIARHPNVSVATLAEIVSRVPGRWDHEADRTMVLDAASR